MFTIYKMDLSLTDYKGILLIGVVVAAIIFFSKDLECVLLMTGIIVNIIAICLNTGATNFKNKKGPDEFLPARRRDLVEKYIEKEKAKQIKESMIATKEEYSEILAEKIPENAPFDVPNVSTKKEMIANNDPQEDIEPYKGAVDYNNCTGEMYAETAADGTAGLSIKHQGINTKRQIAGAMRRKKMLVPYISQELEDEGNKEWWGAYDL